MSKLPNSNTESPTDLGVLVVGGHVDQVLNRYDNWPVPLGAYVEVGEMYKPLTRHPNTLVDQATNTMF